MHGTSIDQVSQSPQSIVFSEQRDPEWQTLRPLNCRKSNERNLLMTYFLRIFTLRKFQSYSISRTLEQCLLTKKVVANHWPMVVVEDFVP